MVEFVYHENKCTHNNNIIDSNNTNINPVTVVLNHQVDSHSPSTKKNFLTNSFTIQMCLVLFIIIFIIILAVLTGFYVQRTSRIAQLEKNLEIMSKAMINEQMKSNTTIRDNKILHDRITDMEKERGKSKKPNCHI
jgi:beta-lactamase regulating signal transducer with metallopeptidase domain